jgi:hypothetical protein
MVRAGQPSGPPIKVFSLGRGDHAKRVTAARSARRVLRNPIDASRKRASPADAFCAQAPYPRATTQAPRKCQTLIVTTQASRNCQSATGRHPGVPGVYLKEIIKIRAPFNLPDFFAVTETGKGSPGRRFGLTSPR